MRFAYIAEEMPRANQEQLRAYTQRLQILI
jgi:hypothetical protein